MARANAFNVGNQGINSDNVQNNNLEAKHRPEEHALSAGRLDILPETVTTKIPRAKAMEGKPAAKTRMARVKLLEGNLAARAKARTTKEVRSVAAKEAKVEKEARETSIH